ncbi:MAG TPA: class I SAM-dependent methyltransferase [Candidatus Udaeobacter sp.]|jgi:hypothetical protein|nr:class I SAM-dependent methyltransferase [Candidatus Udaeobacter sp.]
MTDTDRTDRITGNISANPNPVPFGQGCVLISWKTNDCAGGEVRVSTSSGEERLVSRGGESGTVQIPWITDSITYDFRLYGASQPEKPVDSVKVRRDVDSAPMILHDLATAAMQGNIDITELSRFIATVMPRCLHNETFREVFSLWEQHGFHVTPVHFYQPIPDTRTLSKALWDRPSELAGIDMNDAEQLDLLRTHFPKFRDEYEQFPTKPTGETIGFHFNNRLFDGTDALVAYCMVRKFQPRLMIEIGSGMSSLLLTEAARRNGSSNLICIDPFPGEFVRKGFPGLRALIEQKVQDINLEFFSQLESADVLFIDSSHTVKIGGDVNYLFLEILPRLKPGVIIHVHDIFLPFEYRRDWVMDEFRFWAEQYLLQAFLTFNSEFEVLMANRYLEHKYPEELKAAFPTLERLAPSIPNAVKWIGGSFWIRRKSQLK